MSRGLKRAPAAHRRHASPGPIAQRPGVRRANSLEHERWNPDRVRNPDVGHFSSFAERIHCCGADREGLRSLTNAEKLRRDAGFPPFPL